MDIPRKRETYVTAWLLLMIVVNVLVVSFYVFLLASPSLSDFFGSMFPLWSAYVFSGFASLNIASVCFLLLWKKWAFYLLCGSAAGILAVNLFLGVGPQAFLGLGELAVTYLVIHKQWSQFDSF
jgi:signal transduction histidine kinase